ncbi:MULTISPECIES: hypothetical protein [unclassified Bradyrhizobium]
MATALTISYTLAIIGLTEGMLAPLKPAVAGDRLTVAAAEREAYGTALLLEASF